jgi:hypothetical protein
MHHGTNGVYTSKIIRAGALLPETRTLLAYWDEALSVDENLSRAQQENIFGKASRSWINQFLKSFRERYLADGPTAQALVTLVKNNFPVESLDRVLFFHAAQDDLLLHDTVTEVLLDMQRQGRLEVGVEDIRHAVDSWVDEGKTVAPWSEGTIVRVAQGLMSTLRDFGVLQGAVNKRLSPAYLPVEAFAYIAFYLRRDQPSGERLLQHPEWRLYFLSPESVERLFVEAHQRRLLEYYAAGSVIRITFPTQSIQEYARVILQRTP